MKQHIESFVQAQFASRSATNQEVPNLALITTAAWEIVAWSWNKKEQRHSVLGHAEICAIEQAARKRQSANLNNWRIITTIEPCMMCLGAILEANIKDIVYYLPAPKTGFLVSNHTINLNQLRVVAVESKLNLLLQQHLSYFFTKVARK